MHGGGLYDTHRKLSISIPVQVMILFFAPTLQRVCTYQFDWST